jgi:hypothetical protein
MTLDWRSALALAALLAVAFIAAPRSTAEDPAGRRLRHLVLYKFKPEVPPEGVQAVVDAFSKLPTQIPGIVGFQHGPNMSQEGKSDGLTYAFEVTFRDQAALDAYLVHPAHAAYVNVVKDRREKVVVVDYWVDGGK